MENSSLPGKARSAARRFLRSSRPAPFGPALWILVCAALSNAGWILSAFQKLTPAAYAVLLGFLAACLLGWERSRGFADFKWSGFRRRARRFRRPLPFAFLLLAGLASLGGLLYAPNNYDALAYRIPRVLNWLAEGRWHWIHSPFIRLNDRATGTEWLLAPLLALTGSVRWFFLTNVISLCLMPGLVYSAFTRLGLARKVAWHWMWILPSGYGFITQAGGIGNDLLGVVYVLIAFDFALRARDNQRPQDLWYFMIATALAIGSKASNFPLLLPLFLIVCPRWKLLLLDPLKTVWVAGFAAFASFLPTALMNQHYCQDWTGMRLEGPVKSPPVQFAMNSCIIAFQNLLPPIFPLAGLWNKYTSTLLPPQYDTRVYFKMLEIQAEESAGLGMGICLLVLVSLAASFLLRRSKPPALRRAAPSRFEKFTLWSSYFALAVFAAKSQPGGMVARLITPYYALLLAPVLLRGFDARLLLRRWWKALVALVFALAAVVVIITPARPLWPAQTILGSLHAAYPGSKLIERAQLVYGVYARRATVFAPVIAQLPPDVKTLGFITFDDPEASLWWPLGRRRIRHITPSDTRADLEAMGITYLLASGESDPYKAIVEPDGTLDVLLEKYHAEKVATFSLRTHAATALQDFYLVKLKP